MKIKLIIIILVVIGTLQGSENKNLELICLGSIESAFGHWYFGQKNNFTPVIYQEDYSFKKTYDLMKHLKDPDCALIFSSDNKLTQIDKINKEMLDEQDKSRLQNNSNLCMDKKILDVINKNNKNKILPVYTKPEEGRSLIFYLQSSDSFEMKNVFSNEIKRLSGGKQTRIFIIVDSQYDISAVKQLFIDKKIPFLCSKKIQ